MTFKTLHNFHYNACKLVLIESYFRIANTHVDQVIVSHDRILLVGNLVANIKLLL